MVLVGKKAMLESVLETVCKAPFHSCLGIIERSMFAFGVIPSLSPSLSQFFRYISWLIKLIKLMMPYETYKQLITKAAQLSLR